MASSACSAQRRRQDDDAADARDRASSRRRAGPRGGHEATGRSPASCTAARRRLGYLPQEVVFPRGMTAFGFLDYIAVLKEWADRQRHRRGAAGAGAGRPRRPEHQAGLGPLRRPAATAGHRPGLHGRSRSWSSSTSRPPAWTRSSGPPCAASCREPGAAGTVLLATHQTEDVAALCDRVVVLDAGRIRFDGAVADFIEVARGSRPHRRARGARSLSSWRTGTGQVRSVGGRPGPAPCRRSPTSRTPTCCLRAQPAADRRHPEGSDR